MTADLEQPWVQFRQSVREVLKVRSDAVEQVFHQACGSLDSIDRNCLLLPVERTELTFDSRALGSGEL